MKKISQLMCYLMLVSVVFQFPANAANPKKCIVQVNGKPNPVPGPVLFGIKIVVSQSYTIKHKDGTTSKGVYSKPYTIPTSDPFEAQDKAIKLFKKDLANFVSEECKNH